MNKRLRGDHNQCPTCKELFNSSKAFDKHRYGEYAEGRKCRTREEMLFLGMAVSNSGYWVTKLREQSNAPFAPPCADRALS